MSAARPSEDPRIDPQRAHTAAGSPTNAPALAPGRRFLAVGATWLGLLLATPGFVHPDGFLTLALLGLIPWALAASRPGPKAFWIEWLAAAIGLSAQVLWNVHVLWLTLLAVAIVPGAYMAFAGVVLRRLHPRFALAIAVPVAWIGLETLNGLVEPPFGFLWMRLGHHAHDHAFWLGAMRVVGVGGVGFALASLCGLAADAWNARSSRTRLHRSAIVFTAGALVVCALASLATAPPATTTGPRVVLVQPDFKAVRKQRNADPLSSFDEALALTRKGLAAARTSGKEADFVAWGETVFPYSLADPALVEGFEQRGVTGVPWARRPLLAEHLVRMRETEELLIAREMFGSRGKKRVIPPGTLFLTGAEEYVERDGLARRANSIFVFGEGGARLGIGRKIHLVPGGETLAGLERIPWVRETAFELAGYVPDLVADERTSVVELPLRDGTSVHVGLTVCFDNTYDGPYTEPLRRGPLDFHLIASNEAWYVETWEFDQMLAFSRCISAATGRAMVRATNSGVSIVIDPSGRDVARLVDANGKDRNTAGFLVADVPIPVDAKQRTAYVVLEPWLRGLWVLLPVAFVLAGRRRGYRDHGAR